MVLFKIESVEMKSQYEYDTHLVTFIGHKDCICINVGSGEFLLILCDLLDNPEEVFEELNGLKGEIVIKEKYFQEETMETVHECFTPINPETYEKQYDRTVIARLKVKEGEELPSVILSSVVLFAKEDEIFRPNKVTKEGDILRCIPESCLPEYRKKLFEDETTNITVIRVSDGENLFTLKDDYPEVVRKNLLNFEHKCGNCDNLWIAMSVLTLEQTKYYCIIVQETDKDDISCREVNYCVGVIK
ncbi:TPA: hypothetical protein SFZ43_000027 [Campylobacter jejuni]|nr:hypothetical protein [Campylobacter jejuni]